MAIIRATAVLRHQSGLARDNCVNTFHFTGTADTSTFQAIGNRVREFYEDPVVGGVNAAVAAYIGGQINALDVNLYVIPGTLEPSGRETPAGPPAYVDLGPTSGPFTSARLDTSELPNEVAVCVSYQGTPGPGVVQARRRGRIYVGPLNIAAMEQGAHGPRPAQSFRTTLSLAVTRLANEVDADAEWVVYSRPYAGRDEIIRPGRAPLPAIAPRPATTVNIDQIWVDDEFDTQRRRGLQRTGRTLVETNEA